MPSAGAGDRRRFVFLSTCPEPWGGSEELWWHAACALRRDGHDVHVLKTIVDRAHPRIRALRELGCSVRDLAGAASGRLSAAVNVVAPRRFDDRVGVQLIAAAALVAHRPDVAVVSQGQNFDGAPLARLSGRLRVPYVVIAQKASDFIWPPDHDRAYFRRVLQDARRCVFVSEHNRRLTEEQMGVELGNAVVLDQPLLAGHDGPLPWPGGDELRLACVGRLFVLDKGQDLLLRVLASERWRVRPLHVTFYGGGENAQAMAELARRLGVERVTFAGHAADIDAVWREHHALVLPSRSEGLPLAVLEAMMCGRPAIVTDAGGSAELVTDGVTGFVAAGAATGTLDEALERAWARRDEWAAMGRAAAEAAARRRSDANAPSLADLLLD